MKEHKALILVAEDDESVRTMISRFLKKQGYEVCAAKNGQEALVVFAEESPELVLMDVDMPGMDGIEACARLQVDPASASVPIIMVTALADKSSVDQAFEAGAEEYITKPIHWAVLQQRIRRILSRTRAEAALREKTAYMDSILRSSTHLAIAATDRDFRITYCNPAAETLFGYSTEQVIGRTVMEIPIREQFTFERLEQAIASVRTKSEYCCSLTWEKHGKSQTIDVRISGIWDNNKTLIGFAFMAHDISDRLQIQEIMLQSEKMLSVGGLAAGMAHEINNPLAGMLQNLQVMRNRLSNELAKNWRTAEACGTSLEVIVDYMERRGIFPMLESILTAGQRVGKIVDNMLSFRRQSTARFTLQDLSELLDRTVDLTINDYNLKKHYDSHQIEIRREYIGMPKVPCEGNLLQQVFFNLLRNGIQAMAESKMSVRPQLILRILPEKDMARIEVEDNGPGMDEATRKRVFEPFFTTKEVGMGTGLGLSVAYFIITEKHSGAMAVESSSGTGAKFIIQLPLQGHEA